VFPGEWSQRLRSDITGRLHQNRTHLHKQGQAGIKPCRLPIKEMGLLPDTQNNVGLLRG
jgi:hypothetical protein